MNDREAATQAGGTLPMKDKDSMDLPEGMTCGDCAHRRRCTAMFGVSASNTWCDFFPVRFSCVLNKTMREET